MTAVIIVSDAKEPASVSVLAAERTNVTERIREIAENEKTRWTFVQSGSGRDIDFLVAAHERNNFHNNTSRFKASRHFYRLEGSDIKAFMGNINNIDVAPSNANAIYLWTKRGALRHCKMLGTDTAWDVFDELEERQIQELEDMP